MAGKGRAGEGRAGEGDTDSGPLLWLWRHPRPEGAAGRCIGQTDLPAHGRRAKRLAHRIRTTARRHGLPREVWTSPLRRCADVGRWLARWGWRHRIDARLMELDFGAWDGRPWIAIAWAEVQAWEADFSGHAPGGGECLTALATRVAGWQRAVQAGAAPTQVLVVAHAGVMNVAALGLAVQGLAAADWPRPPGYGALRRVSVPGVVPGVPLSP